MNKHSFNSYLCTGMASVSTQYQCCAGACLSQHNLIIPDMCFELMMCRMMQA
ncbi:hypothetical protein NZD88_13775 [Chryseobacterium antibioticum]|uniref:Uncharacterized protein n=1 Tax=Chryseobacterium pyrolae TaxID=2987481 RepID=A0ABT2IIY4_9FLAO|nr:hypothetical protein [Chryseobacterium pyrolae]MCT2408613.1 hypothetical protein [Chryseobacterium pyrolae]